MSSPPEGPRWISERLRVHASLPLQGWGKSKALEEVSRRVSPDDRSSEMWGPSMQLTCQEAHCVDPRSCRSAQPQLIMIGNSKR